MTRSQGKAGFDSAFNVIAAFDDGHDDKSVVAALGTIGVPAAAITLHRPDEGPTGEEIVELEAEMQDELVNSFGLASAKQGKRAFRAALLAGLIGLVLAAAGWVVWRHVTHSGFSPLGSILIVLGVGGLAGATVGFTDGGGGLPWRRSGEDDRDDQPLPAERDLLLAVHVDDRSVAEQAAAMLRELGAEDVHLVAAGGIPLPPQAQHPRPADPEGFWWTHAGRG
jgi:hypothetical protein